MFAKELELDVRAHLAGAVAAKVGGPRAGDLSNAGIVDRQHRVGKIQVIQHVGERSLQFNPDALADGKPFRQAGV